VTAHTYDDAPTALEYAASLLEQLGAGGTLPDELRQYAEEYSNLREQARQEIADILNGKIPMIDNPIFDPIAIRVAMWRFIREQEAE